MPPSSAAAGKLWRRSVNDALEQLDHEASSCRSRKRSRRDLPNGKNRTGAEIEAKLLLSTRIEVWWEGDQKWYAGEIIDWQWDWVDSKDAAIRHQVVYDIDGQREWDFLLAMLKVVQKHRQTDNLNTLTT